MKGELPGDFKAAAAALIAKTNERPRRWQRVRRRNSPSKDLLPRCRNYGRLG